ncbi:hypothetical protein SS50377_26774 [Spironucleus salmonicida]|uniref:Uncharacterized protein n=1 Tax=Spironucleus salmonicida TaxID=348837 RepID=V6LYC9_9EUKA|nr:hypothetical protein SS50377_26774 [Spironucleus salmonicida]|eukprot:EST49243.1 Hypothetical protein SS50377_10463 [Spironucleus salmonicida]
MGDQRKTKNQKKHQSFDLNKRGQYKTTDRSIDRNQYNRDDYDNYSDNHNNNQYDDQEKQKMTLKERRKLRNKYFEKCSSQDEMETIQAILQEYTQLSPLRITVYQQRMTVPDYKFFIKEPEEFIKVQKHFGDPFSGRSKKNRWLRNTLAKYIGADQAQSNLDQLSDEFLTIFFKIPNQSTFEDFIISDDENDVIAKITQYLELKSQNLPEQNLNQEEQNQLLPEK